MKDKLIWCNTKEKLAKVVAKLRKDGYSTADVDWMWNSYGNDVALRVKEEHKDTTFASKTWYKENDYGDAITADKFLSENKNPSIVIFRRDRNVIAKNVATGNEGIAKCSPDDEFVFKTGAAIALARLMAKTPDALNHDVKDEWIKVLGLTPIEKKGYTDADRNFKVGDRVVVRDWDDMVAEYGVSKWGDIPKDSQFTNSMKHLCGRTATVKRVENRINQRIIIKVDFDDKSGSTCWAYNPWMFNPTDAPAHEEEKPEAKYKVGDHLTLKEGLTADKVYSGIKLLSGTMYDGAYHKRMKVVGVEWKDNVGTYFYECEGDFRFTFYYSEEMLDKWNEGKICEGDTVKVINTGLNYSSYPQWVGKHISDPYMAARYCYGSPNTEKKYKVIKIAEHERNHRPLAYIEEIGGLSYNKCYLIEVEGLEKV